MKFVVELDDDEVRRVLKDISEEEMTGFLRGNLENNFMTVKVTGLTSGYVSKSETAMRQKRRGIFGYMFG